MASFSPLPMKIRRVALFASLLLIGWPTATIYAGTGTFHFNLAGVLTGFDYNQED
jgi:hypothetical protein